MVSQIFLSFLFIFSASFFFRLFFGYFLGWSVGGSVEEVRGPVRRGVHGPRVSVFGSPVCRTCWKVQALSFCPVLRCLSDVLEGSSFIAVWSVSYFVMLLKNFVSVIYQSLRKVCATFGPCTSTRSRFVLNGSPCLIELTRCGRKSNQPSSVAWPLCQPTRCGRKTNQPSSVAWWPLCQPTRCGGSNRELKQQTFSAQRRQLEVTLTSDSRFPPLWLAVATWRQRHIACFAVVSKT